MKKSAFAFFALLILVIAGGCAPKAETFSSSVIENQIRTILEVPTTEYVYREILYLGKEARFLGIKHLDTRLLFSVDIAIQAGFDLTKGLTVINSFKGLTVILPKPEILLVDIDEDSIHQFFVKEWGGKISRMDYYDELNKRKENILQDAEKRGILLKAEENGKKMILNLLQSTIAEDITITVQTPAGES